MLIMSVQNYQIISSVILQYFNAKHVISYLNKKKLFKILMYS